MDRQDATRGEQPANPTPRNVAITLAVWAAVVAAVLGGIVWVIGRVILLGRGE